MNKIKLQDAKTVEQYFNSFIKSKKAKGISEKTLKTYQQHFSATKKYWDVEKALSEINNRTITNLIASMRDNKVSTNTISSYCRTLKSFFSWLKTSEKTTVVVPLYKEQETIKETYTDEELLLLLKKPNTKSFCEYRSWVIINLLLNCGCRAATIRHIENRDIDLDAKTIFYRHTKNGKTQAIPLCDDMCAILSEYKDIRQGEPTDYLFCTETGEQLSENALKLAITRYNTQRGLTKTSIHLFRHTFAKKYLLDCGGNAFTLQKMLGHSTMKMTKHYTNLFDADLQKSFENNCPLVQLIKGKPKIKIK